MTALRVLRSPVALALATFLALAIAAIAVLYAVPLLSRMRVKLPRADGAGYSWLTQALDACEAEAGRYPGSLYFMVVPLVAANPAGDVQSHAMDRVGAATLFDSKVAIEGLQNATLRISREQFILHALDTETSTVYRWNSVSGVSTLSERTSTSKGPFKIRLQTAPDEPEAWSNVTANGVATCHWVFALLSR